MQSLMHTASVFATVKHLKYANGFYVEPQAQLNFTHFGGRNFNVGNESVNQSGVNSTSGKLGLELGKQFGMVTSIHALPQVMLSQAM